MKRQRRRSVRENLLTLILRHVTRGQPGPTMDPKKKPRCREPPLHRPSLPIPSSHAPCASAPNGVGWCNGALLAEDLAYIGAQVQLDVAALLEALLERLLDDEG